jgi:hypothetical protein
MVHGVRVRNNLSSSLLSKNINIKIRRIVILPIVLYGCEIWSPTLRKEHWLGMLKNMVLRKTFRPIPTQTFFIYHLPFDNVHVLNSIQSTQDGNHITLLKETNVS